MNRVLIVTYYWPPFAGGGVQRWLKFCKYLPQNGWQPIIFTPEDPDFQLRDEDLAKEIPEDVEVLRFPIWEPYSIFDRLAGKKGTARRKQGIVKEAPESFMGRLSNWVRGNVFIPDPKILWVGPSIKFLTEFIKDREIDCLVTTGPPHSMHLIGRGLKRRTGIRWLADFRDPWVKWDMLKQFRLSWMAKKYHIKLEKSVMLHADRLLTVSNTWAEEMKEVCQREVEVITNGFDPDEFPDRMDRVNKDEFVISHSGLINKFRKPDMLWQALKELCIENEGFSQRLRIELCGVVDQSVIERLGSDDVLGPKFRYRNYLPHKEVISLYESSSILLLLLNQTENSPGHLPGKLFEYLAAKKFILGIGATKGDAAEILNITQTGKMVDPQDLGGLKKAISSFFTDYRNGNFPQTAQLSKFSRVELTRRLARLLEQL